MNQAGLWELEAEYNEWLADTKAADDLRARGWTCVPPHNAARMNAVGSPTGRVTRNASATSVDAAHGSSFVAHRELILNALIGAGDHGLTSIEAARVLPLTRHGMPQVSNRSASRLGELWEMGAAAIKRERGVCVLGMCHMHHKPEVVHRPTAACDAHGDPITRDGASVWVARHA